MSTGRIFTGILLLAFGVLWLLQQLGLLTSGLGELLSTYWPLILIVWAIQLIFRRGARWFGLLGLMIGVLFQLKTLGIIEHLSWGILWPLVIILIALRLLLPRRWYTTFAHRSRPAWANHRSTLTTHRIEHASLFASANLKIASNPFEGAELFVLFGGIEVDARQAVLSPGERAKVELINLFGGVELCIPEGWQVEIHGIPIFGGWKDHTVRSNGGGPAPILEIEAILLFGGLEVKH